METDPSQQRRLKLTDRFKSQFMQQDPGLLRLHNTARILLTLALSGWLLSLIATYFDLPSLGIFTGTSSATYIILFIRDQTRADRIRISSMALLVMVLLVAPGVWFAQFGVSAAPVLCLLVFIAFGLSAVNQDLMTAGLGGAWIFGFAIYFHPPATVLWWYPLSVAFGGGMAMLIRFVIWRDDKSMERLRLLQLYGLAMHDFIQTLLLRSNPRTRTQAFSRMQELVYPIESTLLRRTDIQDRLYDTLLRVRLGVEGVGLRLSEFTSIDLQQLLDDLALFPPVVKRLKTASQTSTIDTDTEPEEVDIHPVMGRLRRSMLRIGVLLERAGVDTFDPGLGRQQAASAGAAIGSWHSLMPAALRKAFQVTLAVSLASFLGSLISPERWLWAFLAALFMFVGNDSAGQIFQRGWSNVFGSVIGVAIGLGASHLLQGHQAIELLAMFTLLFVGIYATAINYAFFAAGATGTLGLLQSIGGNAVPAVLELRFLEVIVGAGVGVLVAYLVTPVKTRLHMRRSVAELLRSLARLLGQPSAGPTEHRAVHQKLSLFRLSIKPGRSGFMRQVRRSIAQRTGQLMAVVHYVELYDYFRRIAPAAVDDDILIDQIGTNARFGNDQPFECREEDEAQRSRIIWQLEELAQALIEFRDPENRLQPVSSLVEKGVSAWTQSPELGRDIFIAALDRLEFALFELIEDVKADR